VGRPADRVAAAGDEEVLVTVQASNLSFDALPGETVYAAAERNGYAWPTICGGKADCTRCFMEVLEGGENLGPMGRAELAALQERRWRGEERPWERLACCATVHGAVTVRRRSVRRRTQGEVA
jgi:ferredoxin